MVLDGGYSVCSANATNLLTENRAVLNWLSVTWLSVIDGSERHQPALVHQRNSGVQHANSERHQLDQLHKLESCGADRDDGCDYVCGRVRFPESADKVSVMTDQPIQQRILEELRELRSSFNEHASETASC